MIDTQANTGAGCNLLMNKNLLSTLTMTPGRELDMTVMLKWRYVEEPILVPT